MIEIERYQLEIVNLRGELSSRESHITNQEHSIANLKSNIDILISEMEDIQLSRDQCKKDNMKANEKIIQLES